MHSRDLRFGGFLLRQGCAHAACAARSSDRPSTGSGPGSALALPGPDRQLQAAGLHGGRATNIRRGP